MWGALPYRGVVGQFESGSGIAMASALRVGVGLSGDEIRPSRSPLSASLSCSLSWTVLDWHLWADENRSVCRTLICSDFCITPKVSEVPRANKTQLSLAIGASGASLLGIRPVVGMTYFLMVSAERRFPPSTRCDP